MPALIAPAVPAQWMRMGELILGTAQLGQTYGIANRTGQPDTGTARAIVEAAWDHDIHAFDTAPSYGDAECVLGDALRIVGVSDRARVVTKLESTVDVGNPVVVMEAIAHSRRDLGVPQLAGLLIRRTLLDAWSSVRPTLRQLVADGVVERVGVSVYTPDEALQALVLEDVAFVQVPTSILDRRFLAAKIFEQAQALGKRIVVRSVLLQGLITMSSKDAPSIPGAREVLESIRRAADALAMTPIALAIAYVRERCPHADILLGAERPEQVAELAALWAQRVQPCADIVEQYVPAGTIDLIDPTRWQAATHG